LILLPIKWLNHEKVIRPPYSPRPIDIPNLVPDKYCESQRDFHLKHIEFILVVLIKVIYTFLGSHMLRNLKTAIVPKQCFVRCSGCNHNNPLLSNLTKVGLIDMQHKLKSSLGAFFQKNNFPLKSKYKGKSMEHI
jgi:hypothetical protein